MHRFGKHSRLLTTSLALIMAAGTSRAEDPVTPEAAPATAPVPFERPLLPSRSEVMAQGLLGQLPSAEVVTLNTASSAFLALWRPANVSAPKGVILLLPGDGESADWPRAVGPLRRNLPDHGWHTLSLSLPESPRITPIAVSPPQDESKGVEMGEPAPEEASGPSSEPEEAGYLPEQTAATPTESIDAPDEDETPVEGASSADAGSADTEERLDYADQIDQRIEAALTFVRSKQPGTIVLLGHGTGAYWGARFVQQMAPEDVAHLILIQARKPDDQLEPLAPLATALKLPTGDFYYKDGNSNLAGARDRLNESRRIGHPAYQQVGLQRLNGDQQAEQEQLVRRVRGWLDRQL